MESKIEIIWFCKNGNLINLDLQHKNQIKIEEMFFFLLQASQVLGFWIFAKLQIERYI